MCFLCGGSAAIAVRRARRRVSAQQRLFGFLGPVGPALMLAVMIVAAISVHWQNGLFAMSNGIEVPLLYATGATVLALTGPGAYSLDAVLGLAPLWTPAFRLSVLAIGIIGGVANLAIRRASARKPAAA